MRFRATAEEILSHLGISGELPSKLGCRGLALDPQRVQPGMLYVDLSDHIDSQIEAFSRGASLLIVQSLGEVSTEVFEHSVTVPDLEEAFWTLFRWWRNRQKGKFFSVLGEQSFTSPFQEIAAHFLLSKQKGFYRGAMYHDQCELAAEVMNGEDEISWHLVTLKRNMIRLFEELRSDLVVVDTFTEDVAELLETKFPPKILTWEGALDAISDRGALDAISDRCEILSIPHATEESMAYLQDGKVAYLSPDLSLTDWPLPLISSARLVRFVLKLADELEITFSEDDVIEVGRRFYPPHQLGFSLPIGEGGYVWVERCASPRPSELEILLSDEDNVHIGMLLQGEHLSEKLHLPSSKIPVFLLGESPTPQMGVIVCSRFLEVIEALLQTPPFFLIAFIQDSSVAEKLLEEKDEFFRVATDEIKGVDDT